MATNDCFVCPGGARVWMAFPSASGADPNNGIPGTWSPLPHTVTVRIEPNVEEPTEIRTSDTGGNKVPVGSGATSYKLVVSSVLDEEDWLYGYLLDDDDDFGRTLPGNGATLWFAVDWSGTNVPNSSLDAATIASSGSTYTVTRGSSDYAIYLKGTVEASAYGIDNDSTDPVRAEWSVNIASGPFMPITGATETAEEGGTAPFELV